MTKPAKDILFDGHWVKGARRLPSPHKNQRPDPEDISLLVIHYISLPPYHFGGEYISSLFLNTLNPNSHPTFAELTQTKVSSHLLINRSGRLQQFVALNERAWHAGVSSFAGRDNCNDYSIGIELEGDEHTPFTEAQYDTLVALIAKLTQRYPTITPDRIVGHSDVSPGRKSDPGPHFNWARLHNKKNSGKWQKEMLAVR